MAFNNTVNAGCEFGVHVVDFVVEMVAECVVKVLDVGVNLLFEQELVGRHLAADQHVFGHQGLVDGRQFRFRARLKSCCLMLNDHDISNISGVVSRTTKMID